MIKIMFSFLYPNRNSFLCLMTIFLITLVHPGVGLTELGPDKSLVEITLDDNASYVQSPSMEVSPDGLVTIIYEEEVRDREYKDKLKRLWLTRLKNGSDKFEKPVLLKESKDLGASELHVDSEGNLHVVWSDAQKCQNSNLVGHNVILYYQKYDSDLTPVTDQVQLVEQCRRASDFGFEDNSLTSDSLGNIHILHQLGYYVINPCGHLIFSKIHGDRTQPYRSAIAADHKGSVYMAWFVRSRGMGGVSYFRKSQVSGSGEIHVSDDVTIEQIESGWIENIALTLNGNHIYLQIDKESCSGASDYFMGMMIEPSLTDLDDKKQSVSRVYELTTEGKEITKTFVPHCMFLEDKDEKLLSHYISMSCFSCGGADMEVHHTSEVFRNNPKPYKPILSIHPYPGADHGPAFWDEQVAFDDDNTIHLAWYLNNGFNRYKVYYLRFDNDHSNRANLNQVAP